MSRQEIYAWTSLASSLAILGFYIITVFAWPEGDPGFLADLSRLFVKIFLIAFAIELLLGLLETKKTIEKDERDIMIGGKGYRNAYYLLMPGIAFVLAQLIIDKFWSLSGNGFALISGPANFFHSLFFLLFLASIIRRGTQIYFYRKPV